MAALRTFIGCLATVTLLVQAAFGANYAVGGAAGWSLTADLKSWASTQSFKVGDTLTFSYDSQHSIIEVSKPDFDTCSVSSPIQSFTGGNTGIKLPSPGKRYFVCGTVGHCTGGMKVEINTVSAAVATPPPAFATPPPPAIATPPPASPVTPPITSPPTSPLKAPPVPPSIAAPASNSPTSMPVPTPARLPSPSVTPSTAPTSDSPISTPVMTPAKSPSTSSSADFPEMAPTPQGSAANGFSSLEKIGLGLATSMMMALVL